MVESHPAEKNGATPSAFLEKLYDIMENKSVQSYISWQPDGLSFLIKDVQAVSESVLPYYFKHNNIQSFVRQLNMYNFTKTRHDSNYREFRQPMFQRGRRNLLLLIKRKCQTSSEKATIIRKRKFSSNDSEKVTKYGLASFLDENSADETKFERHGSAVNSGSSVVSSINNSGSGGTLKRDDIEEIKEQLSNVKAEMHSLNERYDALLASYLNLHEKFDFFQNEASVYESTTKLPLPVQNHDSIHRGNFKYADFSASLVRVISIDSKSKDVPGEAPNLSKKYRIGPSTSEDSTCEGVCNLPQHLSTIQDEAHVGNQAIMCRRTEGNDGIGLDAMAAAATLRCVRLTPTDPSIRSSFADLLDAATSR